jgi:hypothetical protein
LYGLIRSFRVACHDWGSSTSEETLHTLFEDEDDDEDDYDREAAREGGD